MRIRGKSLSQVTGLLAVLRRLRRPDVYKGKGLRYIRDRVRRKAGKRKTKAVSKKKKFNKHAVRRLMRVRKRKRRVRKSKLKSFLKKRG